MATTLEWFGATTYRLCTNGLVIFLDTWLDRPDILPKYLDIENITEADYIFISHAHFDHLPGADRIAIRTGARVIANGEAINELRKCGVPEEQLAPVASGERIPLFTRNLRDRAIRDEIGPGSGPPGIIPQPDNSLAVAAVHVWPSGHCFMPGTSHVDIPDVMDTGTRYTGEASDYVCTLDITFGMKYGLLRLGELMPPDAMDAGTKSFVDYIESPRAKPLPHYDGGQLSFNFLLAHDKTIFWSGHLGAYDGVLRSLQPKPNVLIQAIAGRGNLNGRPYNGSAAEFATMVSKLLDEPCQVIWSLHDQSPMKPWKIDVRAATDMLEKHTKSRVLDLEPTQVVYLYGK